MHRILKPFFDPGQGRIVQKGETLPFADRARARELERAKLIEPKPAGRRAQAHEAAPMNQALPGAPKRKQLHLRGERK